MPVPAPPDDPSAAEDVVRAFLHDVRSGRRPDRADRYLAPRVRAHQGRPGSAHAVVERSPRQYVAHVHEMLRAVGPWTFEVLGVAAAGSAVGAAPGSAVEATWRQSGVLAGGPDRGRGLVEHGRATYLVQEGRITEYWIEFRHEILPAGA